MAWVYWDDLKVVFNDLMANWYPGRSYHTLADGVVLGDTLLEIFRPQPNLVDGTVFGDTQDLNCTFYVELADGVTVGDANQEYFFEQLSDGVILTDFVIYKKEKSELDINFIIKETVYSFPGTFKLVSTFTVEDAPDEILSWQPVLASFGIKHMVVSFPAKGITFNFTANETDDSFKK